MKVASLSRYLKLYSINYNELPFVSRAISSLIAVLESLRESLRLRAASTGTNSLEIWPSSLFVASQR